MHACTCAHVRLLANAPVCAEMFIYVRMPMHLHMHLGAHAHTCVFVSVHKKIEQARPRPRAKQSVLSRTVTSMWRSLSQVGIHRHTDNRKYDGR